MAFLKATSLILLAGCTTLVIFASTHPHDARGTWISTGSFVPRAQNVFSKGECSLWQGNGWLDSGWNYCPALSKDGDSFVSVWYNGEILIGYLGETDSGV